MDSDSAYMMAASKVLMLKPEMLDQTFDRLQKLVSQLKSLGEKLSQEYVNQKFLRSLSPEWNTHVVVWRNKADLDTMSMDELYYNLKDLEQIYPEDLREMDLRWKMAMLIMRARRFLKKIGRKLTINGNDTIGFDKSNVECYNYHKREHFDKEYKAPRSKDTKHNESTRRTVHVETLASTALVSCDGLGGYDWSDQAEEGPNYALMAYTFTSSDSKIVDNCKKRYGYKSDNAVPPPYIGNFMPPKPYLSYIGLDEFVVKPVVENKSSEKETKAVRKNPDALIIEEWVSDDEVNTVRSKTVNTARPKEVVNVVQGNLVNVVKASACWVWKQKTKVIDHVPNTTGNPQVDLQDKGVIDSGCSRYMIENMSYLTDYEEINEGYVAFGDNLKGGKITGKCTIRTVKPLKYSIVEKGIVEENLHIRFSKNTPNVVGSGPDWLYDIDALTRIMNYEPIVSDSGKKVDKDPSKRSDCKDQEQEDNVNNTNNVNASSTNRVNTVSENISNDLPFDLNMPALEDINTFNFLSDHEDDDEEADMNNMDTTIQMSKVPFSMERLKKRYFQPPGFKDPDFSNKVYNVKKHYIDYIKLLEHDDIIFGLTKKELCITFEKMMHEKFQMSSMGELTFFLGLQVKQKQDGIFIDQDKYVTEILKKYRFTEVKNASTPMETVTPPNWAAAEYGSGA
nr:hypothetical protein [Tanacetum cinerariifolium]